MSYRWIDTDQAVAEYVGLLLSEPRYAMDTEFHAEHRWLPELYLVQIQIPGGDTWIVDPLIDCTVSPRNRCGDLNPRPSSGPGAM